MLFVHKIHLNREERFKTCNVFLAVRSMRTKASLALHSHLKKFLLTQFTPRKDNRYKPYENIWSQGEAHVCVFKRLPLKKMCFLPALYYIYTETIQAYVFSKKLQFPGRFFTNPL